MTRDEVPGAADGATPVDRPSIDEHDVAPSTGDFQGDGQPDDPGPDDDDVVVARSWSRRCLSAQCLTLLPVNSNVFHGCLPALMTPCDGDGKVTHEALVATAGQLMAAGMTGVVYCGSMGDWALLSGDERRRGVEELVAAGIPVVVGTGAPSPGEAVEHAAHAESVGAAGLMIIPRVLSRASSVAAQRAHFAAVLAAAPQLPAVIYNSPYYGFETRADLFFELRTKFPNLVGFKEFGGRAALSRAAEHITSAADDLALVVGVDTEVVHGIVDCGAVGVITGIGNVLPDAVLRLIELCRQGVAGDQAGARPGG